jgi:hypothetical protein
VTDPLVVCTQPDFLFVTKETYNYDVVIAYAQGEEPNRRVVLHHANVSTL